MGSGHWSPDAWTATATANASKSTDRIFTTSHAKVAASGISPKLSPLNVAMRESRDSPDNPTSNAIVVALDVTGSMGMIADTLAREGLGVLFSEILDRKPVTDPHLMFMAVGDAFHDNWPFQVSQFEADNRIVEQLQDIYLEKGGGGNSFESYNLPWYFAAMHTSIDCFEKRGKKGYLFTIGDEEAPKDLTVAQLKTIFGDDAQTLTNRELLASVEKMYHVFHIVVEQGNHCRYALEQVLSSWRDLIGQRVIRLSDYTKLSEVIVSAIQLVEGEEADRISASWKKPGTSVVVAHALDGLLPSVSKGKTKAGVTRFE